MLVQVVCYSRREITSQRQVTKEIGIGNKRRPWKHFAVGLVPPRELCRNVVRPVTSQLTCRSTPSVRGFHTRSHFEDTRRNFDTEAHTPPCGNHWLFFLTY